MKTKTLKKDKVNIITLGCSKNMVDSEVLSDSFRDLLAFTTPPVADPCIYSATISSLSHNRLAKEASALLKSYSLRGMLLLFCLK